MSFANPLLLIGLVGIAIPILIHLFNFRRYKTIHFSNVKMLEDIEKKTRRESQIMHLIVLALRVLGIAALVFAFAQPYIPNPKHKNGKGNLVTIFLDNSYSMESDSKNGTMLNDAVDAAKSIVNTFNYADDFVLTTQDFSGEESHVLNKDQILELLDKIQVSPNSHSFDEVLSFEKNTAAQSQHTNVVHYYISDFQKQNFDATELRRDTTAQIFLIPMPAEGTNNVSIDSCWFLSPVFKLGNQVTLYARITNYGEKTLEKLPVKLYINDKQKAISTVDLQPGGSVDCRMVYTIDATGIQYARITIEDAPIVFDDNLYLTYTVTDNTNIVAILSKQGNRFVQALYGKDSVFNYQAMPYTQVNYTQMKQADVVVMSEVPTISSGMADELSKFVQGGGTLLVLPGTEMDASWSSFLSGLGVGRYGQLVKNSVKCKSVNRESLYFKGAFNNQDEKLDMPITLQHYTIGGSTKGSEVIMSLENGDALLTAYMVGKGKVVLSAVGMDDAFGSAHRHALFFVPLHNIGIMSAMQTKLYNIIGRDNMQTVGLTGAHTDGSVSLKSHEGQFEFIPEQRASGNETALYFHNQVGESGLYDVVNNGTVESAMAFNQDRKESDLSYYDEKALQDMVKEAPADIKIVRGDTKDMAKAATDNMNGRPLWIWFLILALLCFLAEIAILRFWGKAKLNKETGE
ncbi:MAG: BatA domain-containing protein [Bacteroidales bacterium]|nr:BatA domain-containing protein [Bacteroidales bacterium]